MTKTEFKTLYRRCRERVIDMREQGDDQTTKAQALFVAMRWPRGMRNDEMPGLRIARKYRRDVESGYRSKRWSVMQRLRKPLPCARPTPIAERSLELAA
jgi:hypothetical protein